MAIKWQLLDVLAAIVYHITCQADYMCRTTVLASYFLAATYLLLYCDHLLYISQVPRLT